MLEALPLADILDRVADAEELARFESQGRACGWCREPVRLTGNVDEFDPDSGNHTRRFSTSSQPDGVLLKACGSRRATRCPSCSHVYKQDARQLITAGLRGGKGVPESVASRPTLFLTLTAPSFGPVHGRKRNAPNQPCRPGPRGHRCAHGRPMACWTRHLPDAPELGMPLCADCYQHAASVLWNAAVGELWRRTTIYLRRLLARLLGMIPKELDRHVLVSYAKVVEYQRRGVVHVHAVMRLDGARGNSEAPAVDVAPETLALALRLAVSQVAVPLPDGRGRACWGDQLDIRFIARADDGLLSSAVANYIAKYATKSADEQGVLDRRFRSHLDIERRPLPPHHKRLAATAWELGGRPENAGLHLRYWAHDLGYRGHWLTKSRQWSTTLGALRRARQEWVEERRRLSQGEQANAHTVG
ncbi:MAG TPA: replication initiator, partial [Acidimicrobiales bacterium]|nr:replication initiator [Acidimicrobiales bacterium]